MTPRAVDSGIPVFLCDTGVRPTRQHVVKRT